MKNILIPSTEDMIEINKQLGESTINKGCLEFMISKIESKYKDEDIKKQVAKISAIIWMDTIQQHPFVDGNKRSATEIMLLFLKKNDYTLQTTIAGKVYISLKLANNEMTYENLIKWIYERIKGVEE